MKEETSATEINGSPDLVRALEATKRLLVHRDLIAELDPDRDGVPTITSAFRHEQDLKDRAALAISNRLPELAEEADAVATEVYERTMAALIEADRMLAALYFLALSLEEWIEWSQREARLDFGSDLVEAAREDLRKVIPPLPVLELGERRPR